MIDAARSNLTAAEPTAHPAPNDLASDGRAVGESHQDAWLTLLTLVSRISVARLVYTVAVKRTVDLVASVALVILLSPVLAIAAVAVRADSPGPVIFSQQRVGRGGKLFRVYKFRTMAHDATRRLVWLSDERGHRVHKLAADPRVTRTGRWLRRTSIDELPQLFNVIRGEMSLIGPRPELPEIVAQYEPWQTERHLVRPGLTGWWQVSGRSTLPMHENTELDLYYVRHQSFSLDLRIAFMTMWVVVRGLGAF